MNSLAATTPQVKTIHADEWDTRTVGDLARYTLRQVGGIAPLTGGLTVTSYQPHYKVNTRVWLIENDQGRILAEEPSLYKAIHQIATR